MQLKHGRPVPPWLSPMSIGLESRSLSRGRERERVSVQEQVSARNVYSGSG